MAEFETKSQEMMDLFDVLERNPRQFFARFKLVVDFDPTATMYDTYYGNLLHALFLLCGKAFARDGHDRGYYGCKSGIVDYELIREIYDLITTAGVDPNQKNYYGETVYDRIASSRDGNPRHLFFRIGDAHSFLIDLIERDATAS